jgi:hypothetical protein
MSHAPAILAAMTQRLVDATAAGLPCGVPTHSAAGLAEELGVDLWAVFDELVELVSAGHVERLPTLNALTCASFRLAQAVPA